MSNKYVYQRLEGLLISMHGQYVSGGASANAVRGAARADFVTSFLDKVIGPAYRIKQNAEITDTHGNRTGEVDIILENGHFPCIPMLDSEVARLHFAEGVGAAIEVKSNLSSQWDEALATSKKVGAISRKFSGGTFSTPGMNVIMLNVTFNNKNLPRIEKDPHPFSKKIPFFLVGYTGWSSLETIAKRIDEANMVAGILQINPPMYVGSKCLGNKKIEGPFSLLYFLADLHNSFSQIKDASSDILDYAK